MPEGVRTVQLKASGWACGGAADIQEATSFVLLIRLLDNIHRAWDSEVRNDKLVLILA